MSAQQEIRNKAEEEDEEATKTGTDLADFDEAALETGNWDQTEQYAKYMEKNAVKAQEKFVERKLLHPSPKTAEKSQEQLEKEAAAKALDEDVESVEHIYD